tara:strand:+ start:7862 stop:9262 length:1401 start_codon:yes stop_codon:yes gene_type:complete
MPVLSKKPEYKLLSKYKPGSLPELMLIAFPLMLSFLSGNLMFFFDRLIMASYSLDAMNAISIAGIIAAVLQYAPIGIAGIAEVFVGQYNGAKEYKKIAKPVWQMIYFALLFSIICFPVAQFAGPYLIAKDYEELGLPFFKLIVSFAWLMPLYAALTSFYIGRGKVIFVTIVSIVANVINLVLDIVLVFGVSDIIPSMGTKGAALATITAQIIQVLILLIGFFSKAHIQEFGVLDYKFDKALFLKCLKIGLPTTIAHFIEIAAWAFLLNIVAIYSALYLTVITIGQNILILLAFVNDGLSRAVTTVASNIIGAKFKKIKMNLLLLKRLNVTMYKLQVLISLFAGLFLIIFHNILIQAFIGSDAYSMEYDMLLGILNKTLIWIWLYILIDGCVWANVGLLTAAGDTKFIMLVNGLTVWVVAVLPIAILIYYYNIGPDKIWIFNVLYALVGLACYILRIKYKGIFKRLV